MGVVFGGVRFEPTNAQWSLQVGDQSSSRAKALERLINP